MNNNKTKTMLYMKSRRAHYESIISSHFMLLLLGLWISNAIIGCQTVPVNSNSINTKFISNGNTIRPDNIQLTTRRVTTTNNYNEPHSLNLITHDDIATNFESIDIQNYDGNYAIALGAPLLLPRQEDIILDMQDDFTLKCEDNEPIIWKYPLEADVEEETYTPLDKKRRFGKMLILTDLSYLSVGNYYCIKANNLSKDIQNIEDAELVDLTNNNLASSIYVFVNDTDNLLAPMTFPVIHVMQFQDATIPCKPSAPTVEVILTTPMGKTLYSKDLVRYDPRLGFVIALRNVSDTGLYICRPKVPSKNNEDEQTEIELLFAYTTHVDKPNITSNSRHHAYVGDTFKIICVAKIAHDVRYKIEWKIPENIEQSRKIEIGPEILEQTGTHTYRQHTLTIKDAKLSDTGIYTCKVQDHSSNQAKNSYNMIIMEKGTSYINISEPNDYYVIKEKANKTIQMTVRYSGFPWPTLSWYGPNGNEILPITSKKYNITTTDVSSTLKIMNPRLLDSGTYIINATNGVTSKSQQFNVSISDVPIVTIKDVFVQANEKAHVICHVQSHPISIVTWVFEPCSIRPRWPSCNKTIIQDFNETTSNKGDSAIDIINELYFVPKTPGIIRCKAENKIGFAISKAHVLIRDIDDNMTVSGINDNDIIARGDQVVITCAAVAYYYIEDLLWFKDGIPVEERDDIIITNSVSEYSYKKTIVFTNIQDNDQGLYECRAHHINENKVDTKYINIYTYEPSAPRIISTNMGSSVKIERKLGDLLELICESEAIPRASVTWYKDDIEIPKNATNNQQMLVIPYIRPEDEGQYKCIVSNRLGSVQETVNVKISNMPGLKLSWIMGILFILLILIILVIYLCIRVNRERRLLRELKAAGLANFEEGAVEHINPALTLDEQADLLPYDRGFEFSRDKLKLGKQLGAGAFGVVLKAYAEGIRPEEKESVVAVKMVKRNANNEVMRALVSELKIMVHLGQHLNVVNLLGAVTKNIAKRELMVIVEYCRYGNVQNFLLRNRKRFINQINPVTGKIDPTIVTQRFSDNFELNRDGLRYANLPFSNHQYINHMNNNNNMNNNYSINHHRNSDNDPRSGTRAGRPNSTGYITQSELYEGQLNTCATEQTVMTTIPEDDDNNIMSNNSIQPAWRSNYKPDSTEAMSITTTDLISWAFQVACGMEYLSSKKVLHGDLAARNILLCEDNIVKICDFGLARSMYKNDNYKKQGEAPLPIKWLALESLSDHIFSTYTDVWSYGIVLWEFFSLAKVPYPGMDPNQSLYLKLKDGYRMEKPPYANDDLYDIMLECWSTNPERRPLFHVLKEKFAAMLGEEVTNHYVDLNEPYLRVNSEYMKTHQTDYLALMGVPDEMAPAPPARYINGHLLPEIHNDNEQSEKHSEQQHAQQQLPEQHHKQQFSPTIARNMNSPLNSKRERLKKDGIEPLPEEIPMLANVNYNLDDITTNQINNELIRNNYPNYMKQQKLQQPQQHKMPPTPSPRHHIIETKLANDADNYVNIKSPKLMNLTNSGKGPEAFSNPSYQILKTAPDNIIAQQQ